MSRCLDDEIDNHTKVEDYQEDHDVDVDVALSAAIVDEDLSELNRAHGEGVQSEDQVICQDLPK